MTEAIMVASAAGDRDPRTALGPFVLPGLLAMFVAFGMLLMPQYLPADREDGTVLHARATPHGIPGYLIGKLHGPWALCHCRS